jgi:hypothetical protein
VAALRWKVRKRHGRWITWRPDGSFHGAYLTWHEAVSQSAKTLVRAGSGGYSNFDSQWYFGGRRPVSAGLPFGFH